MRKPRIPKEEEKLIPDYYGATFDYSYFTPFLCPDISTGVTEIIPPMLKAIPRVASRRKYMSRVSDALKEIIYIGGFFDAQSVWADILKQRPFISRYPIVELEGNIGDNLGNWPAHIDFLAIGLNSLGEYLMGETRYKAPFPIPYALINGHYSRYAHIPSHNLAEIIEGMILLIKNPDIPLEGLLEVVKGPDFPFGGEIRISKKDLYKLYHTGQGEFDILPTIMRTDVSVIVLEYAPMLEEFGVDDFDEVEFMRTYKGEFSFNRTPPFCVKTSKSNHEQVASDLSNSIFKRHFQVDLNYDSKYNIRSFGLKEILQSCVKNLQKYHADYRSRKTPDNDYIIKKLEKIKMEFGDNRRTLITLTDE